MPVTKIKSRWSSGNLIFHESISLATIADVLTIGTTAITVGSATNDINFSWLGTTTGTFVLDAGAHTLVTTGLDWTVTGDIGLTGNITVDVGDVQIGDDDFLMFGDGAGGDINIEWDTSGTDQLNVIPLADNTLIAVGNGTLSCDLQIFGGTADYYIDWDADEDTHGTWNFGADTKGIDVKFFGATTGHYLQWDKSADDLILYGAGSRIVLESTVNSTTTTSGSIQTDGGLGVVLNSFFGGSINMVAAAAGTLLDFVLETEWVSGTLIDADFAGATTLSDDAIGMEMDFNGNVTMTTDKDLTIYKVSLPALTQSAANVTNIIGWDLNTAGALVQDTAAGTIAWKGFNIQMPNQTQTTGTVACYGINITAGTITSGSAYGIYIGADTAGLDVKFESNTTGNYLLWDTSADDLLLVGTATQFAIAGDTDASNTTSGSLRTAGGLGVVKAAYIGGLLDVAGVATFAAQDIHTLGLTVADAKAVVQGMNTFSKLTPTILTSNSGYTMTAAQMLSGLVRDTSGTGGIAATLPTVAAVVALVGGYVAGTSFYLDYSNPGNQTVTLTVDASAQWTMTGTMTIATTTHRRFLCVINSATTGTVYSIGDAAA